VTISIRTLCVIGVCTAMLVWTPALTQPADAPDASRTHLRWDIRIPLRDGIELSAIAYLPRDAIAPAPCIVTLTPYVAASYHDAGVYFAAHGLPFVSVDVRGRGNSGGSFRPLIQEARDGYDVVEWLARQSYCNGKVAMWGGSYAGYDQWATAKERPPHLSTIVPAAAAHPGVDFPARNNIPSPYLLQWLTLTAGHTSQAALYGDDAFWAGLWSERFKRGEPLDNLEYALGGSQPTLHEWIAHTEVDSYFDAYVPTCDQYAALEIPILTITGSYDADQGGALAYYRHFMRCASTVERSRHYLVIGPWDHAGTRKPTIEVGGVKFGPAALLDLPQLHLDWYGWVMSGGVRPPFLRKPVAYYVMGAETWRYADTLDAVTAQMKPLFPDSSGDATRVFASGTLSEEADGSGKPDRYVYDPKYVADADLQARVDPYDLVDQRLTLAADGKQLIYHSAPFNTDREISGFFMLSAWLAIDTPDTDFMVSVYEIEQGGRAILLTNDVLRARYRDSLREVSLIHTLQPLHYDFDHFTFVSRRVAKGSRLRLVIGPINSIYSEKNFNSGGVIARESLRDARPVTVTLFHDRDHRSALIVPYGQSE
jgi:putative CocE/NonD family hydrolase